MYGQTRQRECHFNGRGSGTQTLLSQSSSCCSLGVFNYNPSNARYQLVKFIVINRLSFLIATENTSLEELVNEASTPLFKKIYRNIVRNAIKMFRKRNVELKSCSSKHDILENRVNFGFMDLQTEYWTHFNNHTLYWKNLDMQKRMISSSLLEYPHIGARAHCNA